jgi:hypothetical protein
MIDHYEQINYIANSSNCNESCQANYRKYSADDPTCAINNLLLMKGNSHNSKKVSEFTNK